MKQNCITEQQHEIF